MAVVVHEGGLYRLSPIQWGSLEIRVMLFHEASTAAPTAADEFVSDLVPASNELVNDDYDRQTLTGKGVSLVSGAWELEADDVSFGVLTGESLGQGANGWSVFVWTGSDATSPLLVSKTFADVTLNGTEVVLPWTDGVVGRVAES